MEEKEIRSSLIQILMQYPHATIRRGFHGEHLCFLRDLGVTVYPPLKELTASQCRAVAAAIREIRVLDNQAPDAIWQHSAEDHADLLAELNAALADAKEKWALHYEQRAERQERTEQKNG